MSTMAIPSPIPYFGRAWEISVDTPEGRFVVSSSDFKEPLRVVFNIQMQMLLAYWTADVIIYNLSKDTASQIVRGALNFNEPIHYGDTVNVSAGYRNNGAQSTFDPTASLLYSGHVLQPIWTREQSIDYRLTLRCYTGLLEDSLNFVSTSFRGDNQLNALTAICGKANIPIESIDSSAQSSLENLKLPRGCVIHDRPFNAIKETVQQKSLYTWVSPRGLNVRTFDAASMPTNADITYGTADTPDSQFRGGVTPGTIKKTLIGTPQQVQDGITLRVLLDSEVKIGQVIQLAQSVIVNLAPIQFGDLQPITSPNGLYVVAGMRHFGDTRGEHESWYTEITAFSKDFFANILKGSGPHAS